MTSGIRLTDIVVRVYADYTHDGRLAARLAARRIINQRGTTIDDAERDVLERVRRGDLCADSLELSFSPTCFATIHGERRIDGVDNSAMPPNSFGAKFFSERESIEPRLRKRRMGRYARLGGAIDAIVMDKPLWDYVSEWLTPRLDVEDAEPRLAIFARRASEGRAPRHDPIANRLARLHDEGSTDELLREIWTRYSVQAKDLKLPRPTAKPGDRHHQPAWQRLAIIPQTGGNDIAKLDDLDLRINTKQATLLTALKDKQGGMVLATQLTSLCGDRADRIFNSLPSALQAIVDRPGKGKSGYRMF